MDRRYEKLLYLSLALGLLYQSVFLVLEVYDKFHGTWMVSSSTIVAYGVLIRRLIERNQRAWQEWQSADHRTYDDAESKHQDWLGRTALTGFVVVCSIGLATTILDGLKYLEII